MAAMAEAIPFNKTFEPHYGRAIEVAPGVRRVTAQNPSPTTFHGTNSYILGAGRVAIVDPGPDDGAHVGALLAATEGETVSHIVLTHTHRDHSGAVAALKHATGAKTAGSGPHRPSRPPRAGETARLDAAGDAGFAPDLMLADGDAIEDETWRLEAISTPGHTANHLALALSDHDLIFSGDHVMAWSTTIVAPPDGAMRDYIASLDKLAARREQRYLPGHGGPVEDAHNYVRALKGHRRMREAAILERLTQGDRSIAEIVAAIYRDTDPRLHRAAGLTVLAHLEDLVAAGKVESEGLPSVDGSFRPAR
jgi:glyoxylase-like metal-dependent hydrolase (beta-lactamase superfamily II)